MMSKCVVHMMKNQSSAVGGLQSHNQREHESSKNKDIVADLSAFNIDTVNDDRVNYRQIIKERIESLNLQKAVRKDAVVYCSFIVSSDRTFFEELGAKEHKRREWQRESISIGLEEPVSFFYCDEQYRADCIREGSKAYFEDATDFFQDRYGKENVICGAVHFDEVTEDANGARGFTPHLHLGVVPITAEKRLSAKTLFDKKELTSLQSDFAEQVGRHFGMERGTRGSKATHVDELDFKIQKKRETAERLDGEVSRLSMDLSQKQREIHAAELRAAEAVKKNQEAAAMAMDAQRYSQEAEKARQSAFSSRRELEVIVQKKTTLEVTVNGLQEQVAVLEEAIKGTQEQGLAEFGMSDWQRRILDAKERAGQNNRLRLFEKFISLPQIKPLWEQFCKLMKVRDRGQDIER